MLLFSVLAFSSCEDIIDCIFNVSPELPNKDLQVGYLNDFYSDEIKAEINNEPRDDDYAYYFDIYGDLPQGLEVFYDFRTVIIEGTPQESGVYNFTIALSVDPPVYYDYETDEYYDPLCSDSTSRGYSITIN